MRSRPTLLIIVVFFVLNAGCVMHGYRFGRKRDSFLPKANESSNVITYDAPHPTLDKIEKTIFSPIDRLSSFFGGDVRTTESREQQMQTSLECTLQYLASNDLGDVNVDVRRYNPRAQWIRLRQNQRMHPLIKYTAGSVTWAVETIIPARVFRYTTYNPYTNTLSVNSVWREWNISEAARAKDYLGADYIGLYALSQHIPFVPLIQETRIGCDALTYARTIQDRELELDLYPYVYGEVMGCTFDEASFLVPGIARVPFVTAPAIWGGSFAIGYGAGSLKRWQMRRDNALTPEFVSHASFDDRPRIANPVTRP